MKKILNCFLIILTSLTLSSCNNEQKVKDELNYILETSSGIDYSFLDDEAFNKIQKDTNYIKSEVSNYVIFTSKDKSKKFIFKDSKLLKILTCNKDSSIFNIHIGDIINKADLTYYQSDKVENSLDIRSLFDNENEDKTYLKERNYSPCDLNYSYPDNFISIKEASLDYLYYDYTNQENLKSEVNDKQAADYHFLDRIFLSFGKYTSIYNSSRILTFFSIEVY